MTSFEQIFTVDLDFFGQKPDNDEESIPYEDLSFPPAKGSIYRENERVPTCMSQFATFKRPTEYLKSGTPALFKNGTEYGDVVQGALGDCWFISSLAVLATRYDILQHTVKINSTNPKRGHYAFRFFKDCEWKTVHVDDFLPVDKNNNLLFGRCKDPTEIWVPLLEKAYAKLFGQYTALEAGVATDALVDMTGGVAFNIDINQKNMIETFNRLLKMQREGGYFIAASSFKDKNELGDIGLVTFHAYSILDVRYINGHRLLKIRNPWGSLEWKGKWSDADSASWTAPLKKYLGYVSGDDGTFFMCIEDFAKYFSRIEVVRVFNDPVEAEKKLALGVIQKKEDVLGWKCQACKGEWVNSPGCVVNVGNAEEFPQYLLNVTQDADVCIDLIQKDVRYGGVDASEKQQLGIGVDVFPYENAKTTGLMYPYNPEHPEFCDLLTQIDSKSRALYTGYVRQREVCVEGKLKAGTYFIIPSLWDEKRSSSFTLRVFVNGSPFTFTHLKKLEQNSLKSVYLSSWTNETAGGCQNHSTWINNPQFLVTIDSNVPESDKNQEIFINLKLTQYPSNPNQVLQTSQTNQEKLGASSTPEKPASPAAPAIAPENVKALSAIGLYCLKPTEIDENMPVTSLLDQVAAQPVFIPLESYTQSLKVKKNTSFIVIPTTFNPNEESNFSLEARWRKDRDSDVTLSITRLKKYKRLVFESEWNEKNAGGCTNNPANWKKNPQYKIKFTSKLGAPGTDKRKFSGYPVQMTMFQGEATEYALGMEIFQLPENAAPQPSGVRVLKSQKYLFAPFVTEMFWQPEFGVEYTLIPTTFNAGEVGKFKLIFDYHSSVEMSIKQVQ